MLSLLFFILLRNLYRLHTNQFNLPLKFQHLIGKYSHFLTYKVISLPTAMFNNDIFAIITRYLDLKKVVVCTNT